MKTDTELFREMVEEKEKRIANDETLDYLDVVNNATRDELHQLFVSVHSIRSRLLCRLISIDADEDEIPANKDASEEIKRLIEESL